MFKQCGSCQYLHIRYQDQLKKKQEYCQRLVNNSHLKIKVQPVIGQDNPYHYRNKVIVGFDRSGKAGLYEENSHHVVPYDSCLLHDGMSDEIIQWINQWIRKYHVSLYQEDRRTGFLRHVYIRTGVRTNERMLTLVVTSFVFPGSKNFVKEITKKFPSIKTIVLNLNKRKTSIVLGDECKIIYGKGFIYDELCGLKFKISPHSFYQINHDQCEILYKKAISLLELRPDDVVLDTYCGIGTIGLICARNAKHVVGVELNKEAVKDARNNARLNKINNIEFIQGDSTEFMHEIASANTKVDIVVMDPPRSGSTKDFIKAVSHIQPRKVVYISCDPRTQVRDLVWFKEMGYYAREMFPVDMFPHTKAIESIVLLTRK